MAGFEDGQYGGTLVDELYRFGILCKVLVEMVGNAVY